MISGSYAPSQVEINSLGIGLAHHSNIENLDLKDKEYLVVGEQGSTTNDTRDIKYSLIVNNDIVGVNTSRRRIDGIENDAVKSSSLFVGNDIICDGNIIAKSFEFSDVIVNGDVSDTLTSVLNKLDKITPLVNKGYSTIKETTVTNVRADNIYSTSFLTLGSKTDTYQNTNPLNVVSSTNYNVKNIHLSIDNNINNENGESAKMRIGMVGDTAYSPAVITTTYGMPLQFHIGMNTQDVNDLYSDKLGFPNYEINSNFQPSLVIDTSGSVGFGIQETANISYNKYVNVNNNIIIQKEITKKSKIEVQGGALFDDIIMFDYYSRSNLHLDDIYVRKVGLNFEANQIIPGNFIQGEFKFNDNLYIGNVKDNHTLEVNSYLQVNGDINVSNNSILNKVDVSGNSIFRDKVNFYDVVNLHDAIVDGDFNINNGDLKIDNIRINISEMSPLLIDAEIAAASNIDGSNILFFASKDFLNFSGGSNFAIPGRLGTGILETDSYNEQFNVIKRKANQFEILLQDSSVSNELLPNELNSNIAKSYIGHLNNLPKIDGLYDRSLIFNTNEIENSYHNIYFYPGKDLVRREMDKYVPTFTIHQNNNIGINIKTPKYPLHVNGEILGNDLYLLRNTENFYEAAKSLPFILKKSGGYSGDISENLYYLYDINNANKFNVNFVSDRNVNMKSFNVKGGIHSVEGGYYENNVKLSMLKILNDNVAFTNKHIHIGNKNNELLSDKPIMVRNILNTPYNDSIIRLYRGIRYGAINKNSVFTGIDLCSYDINDKNLYKWFMYRNHQNSDNEFSDLQFTDALQFGYTNGTQQPTHSGMTMYFNDETLNYHIDINNKNIDNEFKSKTSAMSIYGDLDVHGSVNLIGTSNSYKINGINVSPTAIDEVSEQINNDEILSTTNVLNDVVISGDKIAILPKKTLAIGNVNEGFASYLLNIGKADNDYKVPLTVFQNGNEANIKPVCSFVTNCSEQNINKSSSIELSIIDTSLNSLKKNSVNFNIRNFNDNSDLLKTKFELSSYTSQSYDKMFAIYDNGYTNYFNIGNSSCENNDGTLKIEDISNVSLHIENSSKYLLQLTNSANTPAINFHKKSTLNKFWTIEGPTDNNSLLFSYSEKEESYIPDDDKKRDLLIIAPTGIGINNLEPNYSLDVISKDSIPSLSLTNSYSNYSIAEVNTTLPVRSEHFEYTYNYSFANDKYTSEFNYVIGNTKIPIAEVVENAYDIYRFNTHEIANYVFKESCNILNINKKINHFVDITCNNLYLESKSEEYEVLPNGNVIDLITDINVTPYYPTQEDDIYELSIDDSYNIPYTNVILLNIENNYNDNNLDLHYSFQYQYSNNIMFFGNDLYTSNIEIKENIIDENGTLYTDILITTQYNEYCDENILKISTNTIEIYSEEDDSIKTNVLKTSNIILYSSYYEYDVHLRTTIKKKYDFETIIKVPEKIASSEIERTFDYNIVETHHSGIYDDNGYNKDKDQIFKTIEIYSKTKFLTSNNDNFKYVRKNQYDLIKNRILKIFNDEIYLNIKLYDDILVFNEIDENKYTICDIDVTFYKIDSLIHEHHLALQNVIQYTGNDGSDVYGKSCKIYNRNGSLEITTFDNVYENPILNISNNGNTNLYGDLNVAGNIYANKNEGILEIKNLKLWGDVYDRLGNSMLFNYSEDMYNQAFIMQSSNYILYTSNYNISSTSNIEFKIYGNDNISGVKIKKEDGEEQESYNIFSVEDNNNTVFSVNSENSENKVDINGNLSLANGNLSLANGNISLANGNISLANGNVGINKEPSIDYDLDVNNKIRSKSIYVDEINIVNKINSTCSDINYVIDGHNNANGFNIMKTSDSTSKSTDSIFSIKQNSTEIFKIQNGGNVGINTVPDSLYDLNTKKMKGTDLNILNKLTVGQKVSGILLNEAPVLETKGNLKVYGNIKVENDVDFRHVNMSNVNINGTINSVGNDVNFEIKGNNANGFDIVKKTNDIIPSLIPSYYLFSVKQDTTDVFKISKNGKVGINKQPDIEYDLDVHDKIRSTSMYTKNIHIQNTTDGIINGVCSNIGFKIENNNAKGIEIAKKFDINSTPTNPIFTIKQQSVVTGSETINESEVFKIIKGGNIGINTTPDTEYDLSTKKMKGIELNLSSKAIIGNKTDKNDMIAEEYSLEILGNLKVYGNVVTLGDSKVYEVEQQQGTSLKVSGESSDVGLSIQRNNPIYDWINISNLNSETLNSNIFVIDYNGNVSIGNVPFSDETFNYKLSIIDNEATSDNVEGNANVYVQGVLKASKLYGDGYNITNLNFEVYDTDVLDEGTLHLYYTDDRVSNVIEPIVTNIYIEVEDTSNNISEILNKTSNNIYGYTNLTSNNIYSYLNLTSNNIYGYTNLTSNNIYSYLNSTSNNIYGYTNLTSNNIYSYLNSTSNNIYNGLNLTSNTLINFIGNLNTDSLTENEYGSNKFIVNNVYKDDLIINGTLYSCNLSTSNIIIKDIYNDLNYIKLKNINNKLVYDLYVDNNYNATINNETSVWKNENDITQMQGNTNISISAVPFKNNANEIGKFCRLIDININWLNQFNDIAADDTLLFSFKIKINYDSNKDIEEIEKFVYYTYYSLSKFSISADNVLTISFEDELLTFSFTNNNISVEDNIYPSKFTITMMSS